jgi:hypothetical protein
MHREPQRVYETPSFTLTGGYSVTLTFIAHLEDSTGAHLSLRLASLRARLKEERREVYDALVLPVSSFFDDIVDVACDPDQVPLLMTVEPAPASGEDRCVELLRPEILEYDAEGDRFEIVRRPAVPVRFGFRDSITLFASGHVVYTFALIPPRQGAAPIDEYHLIELEKLANPTEETLSLRENLHWRRAGTLETFPLVDFINRRLEGLRDGVAESPNGPRDVLVESKFCLEGVPKVGWGHLTQACVIIEDPQLYEEVVNACTPPGRPGSPKTCQHLMGMGPHHRQPCHARTCHRRSGAPRASAGHGPASFKACWISHVRTEASSMTPSSPSSPDLRASRCSNTRSYSSSCADGLGRGRR